MWACVREEFVGGQEQLAVVVPVTVVVDGCDCVHGCECGWVCYCGGGRAGGLSLPGCGPARIGLGGAG